MQYVETNDEENIQNLKIHKLFFKKKKIRQGKKNIKKIRLYMHSYDRSYRSRLMFESSIDDISVHRLLFSIKWYKWFFLGNPSHHTVLLHLRILRFLQFLSSLADRYQNKYQSIIHTTLSNLPGYVCGLKLSFILPTLQRHQKRVVKKKVSCFLKKDCFVLFRSKKKIKTFWDTQGIKGETISVWSSAISECSVTQSILFLEEPTDPTEKLCYLNRT